ncbi:hypothetical protein ACUNFO_24645, partial [Serratia sp. IR-2025]
YKSEKIIFVRIMIRFSLPLAKITTRQNYVCKQSNRKIAPSLNYVTVLIAEAVKQGFNPAN